MNSCQLKNKLKLEKVSKNYSSDTILECIDIDLYEGEMVAIIGPSGCGKSTIFNLISGLEDLSSGKVLIDGDVSYMYQKDLLLSYKTIIDNVSLPLQISGMGKDKARKKALEYFDIFGISGYENNFPRELSGGMRQRVNFMRSFMLSNDIMLLDEPFASLDQITKNSIQDWFMKIRDRLKITTMLVTHDIEEAIKLSDRIYVLSNKPTKVSKVFDISKGHFDKNDLVEVAKLKKDILGLLI